MIGKGRVGIVYDDKNLKSTSNANKMFSQNVESRIEKGYDLQYETNNVAQFSDDTIELLPLSDLNQKLGQFDFLYVESSLEEKRILNSMVIKTILKTDKQLKFDNSVSYFGGDVKYE
jgi:hypothetical protein